MCLGVTTLAHSQEAPKPSPTDIASASSGLEAAAPPAAPATPSVEERLKELEETNRQLREQNRQLLRMVGDISREVKALKESSGTADEEDDSQTGGRGLIEPGEMGQPAGAVSGRAAPEAPGLVPSPDPPTRGIVRSADIGRSPGAAGGLRDAPNAKKLPVRASFGAGFELRAANDEYELQIHNMTSIEERLYTRADQTPVHSGFYLARQRWYFSGRITKPIEYYIATNRSYGGNFDLLDAYLNFHYDDRVQLRYGRYRVPYSFEWYAYPIQYHLQPERSVFGVNFGLNRMLGFQAWGQPFDRRLDYAVGVFNGARNSFQPFNNSLDAIAFLNFNPFKHMDEPLLKFLNFGGSVDYGNETNPLYANPLRTSQNGGNSSTTIPASPAFLAFNNGVTESGIRDLWSIHVAYYYKHLSLIAEWESGFETYALGANHTRLPLNGYYVSAGYFLTGEIIEGRGMVKPLRPFDLRKGKFGPGAWELAARYASLDISNRVFTAGLADPNLWTNRVGVVDAGVNWHINEYVKLYFLWEHCMFASPVLYRPGGLAGTNDLFWTRLMFYY
jgi:phosphate-selective porin OprO/OprP